MTNRSRLALVVALALAISATAALSGGAAQAKKKGGGSVDSSKQVNTLVPNAIAAPFTAGALQSTIEVGNKFKGKKIRDVNVTLQVTGTGTDSISNLEALLQAPNGASTVLFIELGPGNLLGPLTLDDESRLELDFGTPDDTTGLFPPYAGTAQPAGFPLAVMDGGRVKGTWTLTLLNFGTADTNTLNSWSLKVRAGKPYETS